MWFNASLPSRQKQKPKDNIESETLVSELTRNEVNNKGIDSQVGGIILTMIFSYTYVWSVRKCVMDVSDE